MRRLIPIALLAAAPTAHANPDPAKQMVVVPAGATKLVPLDPARPNGPRIAVLRGDPVTGPSTMLMEFPKSVGVLHIHTSDYHLVVLEGTMKHWGERESEPTAKPLGPGSYWFQPGGQAHADSCVTDRCLMFISWSGKRDSRALSAK